MKNQLPPRVPCFPFSRLLAVNVSLAFQCAFGGGSSVSATNAVVIFLLSLREFVDQFGKN